MMRLGRTNKGHMIMVSDEPLPAKVKRVEYYREQKLFTFVFEDENEEDMLSEYEVTDEVSDVIKSSPDIIIMALTEKEGNTDKYLCPLVQIGV